MGVEEQAAPHQGEHVNLPDGVAPGGAGRSSAGTRLGLSDQEELVTAGQERSHSGLPDGVNDGLDALLLAHTVRSTLLSTSGTEVGAMKHSSWLM